MSKFDEYKLLDERIQRLSERRQNSSQTYFSINTFIFSVFAFLVKDMGLSGQSMALVSIPLFLVGISACVVWIKIITDFKKIIGWHYEQLREIEKTVPESNQIYNKEWSQFFEPRQGKDRFSFSNLELSLPRILIVIYVIYGIIMVVTAKHI
jgi:hypothetical protein